MTSGRLPGQDLREAREPVTPGFDPGSFASGLIVIALGLLLLLDRAGAIDLGFDYWWPAALAALGGVLLACGLAGPARGGR